MKVLEGAGLPPGQRAIRGFPRFGAHLARPAPPVPVEPVIAVGGAVVEPFELPLAVLATLDRVEVVADFHCVAGWSARDLGWEGVAFETLYRALLERAIRPDTAVTHVVFAGLDGYRSVVLLDDALSGVLIADHLDGRPLDGDHGSPVRVVSPDQYGYISVKHLCRIDLHTSEPSDVHRTLAMRVLKPHLRARVWEEERHRYFPAWSIRTLYRMTRAPIAAIIASGDRRR